MRPFVLHVSAPAAAAGSPLYDVSADHEIALVAVVLLPLIAWLVRRWAGSSRRLDAIVAGYDGAPVLTRFVAWLLVVSATVHLALVVGHGGPTRWLFLVQAGLLAVVVGRLLTGRSWRAAAAAILLGSIAAWCGSVLGGEPPDQVGVATKLVEIAALAVVVRPAPGRRVRGAFGSAVVIVLVVATSAASWIGAFQASAASSADSADPADASGRHGHQHGHTAGTIAAPGSVTVIADAEPTAEQREAAAELWTATAAAIAPYRNPAHAAAAGYDVSWIQGTDFHAGNPGYEQDGLVLDPARPEALVYAAGPSGPVLLGAMFVMPGLGGAGPAIGGSLTMWHAHELICISLTPPSLTGVMSPLGNCPVGSIAWPLTPEMIHVWTVPGAPQRFGDLDSAWRERYLADQAARN